ncbi:MAG: tripartite tricarboxylate transporter substrate-binding protein [Magnetospirillum sp.]|nr:tripartite tricarboxylate transporter substrate-binding protein [Magnetospirillum sp.]
MTMKIRETALPRRTALQLGLGALAAPVLLPGLAQAQAFPAKPIRLVVASAAGGNADVVARLVANDLEPRLGQRVLVENIPAASGMRATEDVSRSAPDGHTLLVGTSSQLVFNMALFDPMPVDLPRTLSGVAMLNFVPLVLCVNKDNPAATLRDYIARVKAAPGRFQYGSGPVGTTTHVVGLLFARQAELSVEHVPYQAGAQAMRDLVAGRLSHMFDVAVTAIPQLNGGAVRGLGLSALVRSPALPDLPTIHEAGLANFQGQTWNSIAAPAATPKPIVDKINAEVAAVLAAPAMRTRLIDLGSTISDRMTPTQVDAFYASERDLWIPIVRATGARAA